MSIGKTGVRETIYFSKRKDRDLIQYFKQRKGYDFSALARDLMRDGIQYRKQQEGNVIQKSYNVIQNKTTLKNPIPLTRKEVSPQELEANLDNF